MTNPAAPLLRFDRKVWAVLGALLVVFTLATAFKLNGSSICIWNAQHPDRLPRAGVLLGTPHAIRSDEWAFVTPAIVSQSRQHPPFALENPAWGVGRVPLIADLPARHWSVLLRPQFWGFFVLDLERGFAFFWNMKAVLLLGGIFLLLLLLTENDFWVSLLGAAWLYFSGFTQWWYSSPTMMPETIGCVALVLVAAHYLVLSPHRWVIAGASLALVVFLSDAILSFYPPFQVALFYLALAIVAGSVGPRLAGGTWRRHLRFRLVCAAATIGACAVLLALYYRDIKSTVDVMRATLYPGSRTSTGGDLNWAQIFGGFYGFFMSEGSYPEAWRNVCEASNFVLVFPVPIAAIVWRTWRERRWDRLEWSLVAYLVVVLSWSTLGWPSAVAVVSGFALTHGTRVLLGTGLASILLCCVFLSRRRAESPEGLGPRIAIAAAWLGLLVAIGWRFDGATGGFAGWPRVLVVCVVAGAAGYFLLARQRIAFAACLLVPSIWSFGLVNPVAVGLGPILETNFYREVSRIVDRDPEARWAVYGSDNVADLIKAAGGRVWNGTKVVPQLADFRVLDPRSSAALAYNRYAHVTLVAERGEAVGFELSKDDAYKISIDPNSELWRRLGIKYVALPFEATDGAFVAATELVLALPDVEMWIYRYR